MRKNWVAVVGFLSVLALNVAIANPMEFKLAWESPKLTRLPIALMTSADLNGNGVKELIFTDFSHSTYMAVEGDEALMFLKEKGNSKIMIWEWQGKSMKLKWEKQFPPATSRSMESKYFGLVNQVKRINTWTIKGKDIIEADPPFFRDPMG